MKNEMNLMHQTVAVLIKSATHKKDYGRELETLDDVAAALNLEECNKDRKRLITGNVLKVAKYKIAKTNQLQDFEPDWEKHFEKS